MVIARVFLRCDFRQKVKLMQVTELDLKDALRRAHAEKKKFSSEGESLTSSVRWTSEKAISPWEQ